MLNTVNIFFLLKTVPSLVQQNVGLVLASASLSVYPSFVEVGLSLSLERVFFELMSDKGHDDANPMSS